MHASRAVAGGNAGDSGGRVRNTWGTYPGVGASGPKGAVIPPTARAGDGAGESGNAPWAGPAAH
jgi:hypothetical protein